ncbi:GcrA family cell cycle regulator [Beijerinckia sp. L45]|uniref:GcrA family cell cycle regulator n=1 Tax=Beijerinckia sp. L45 TaxID=1641855 RepID=UPI00131AD5AE|nr:GcrA family cell cycle regulator [Beijerinckia sp. L45]
MGALAEKLKPDDVFAWTDARIEFVKQRHGEGASAAQIATELGRGVSRSAVLGKIFRLGLSKPQAPALVRAQQRPAAAPARALRSKVVERSKQTAKPAPPPPVRIAPVAALAEPVDGGLEIHELRDRSCRWPVGAPGGDDLMRYCGAGVSEAVRAAGLCYCPEHMKVAYPPKEARRRP